MFTKFSNNAAKCPPLALSAILAWIFALIFILMILPTFDWLLFNNTTNLCKVWADYYVIEMLKHGKLWFIKDQLFSWSFLITFSIWSIFWMPVTFIDLTK